MKKLSLSQKGLSLSQAQSISNLCFQRAKEIEATLSRVNNATKVAKIDGEEFTIQQGVPMPDNVVELILEKSRLHATQAFLMENIKGKDFLINQEKSKMFKFDVQDPKVPEYLHYERIPLVGEDWGWEQLSIKEINEYLMAEAYAAHIGQFIHKGSTLEKLRKEISVIGNIEWIDVKEGQKTPVRVQPHHSSEELLHIHEQLAGLHRQYEQKVNYYKAKVKNLITLENARISEENEKNEKEVYEANKALQKQYNDDYMNWSSLYKQAHSKFEAERQLRIKEIAAMRIEVGKEFKDVVDGFLQTLSSEE
jgi:hypothetical protein